jgi:hypothetical protein
MANDVYKKGQQAVPRSRSWTDATVQQSIASGNLYNVMGSFTLRQDMDGDAILKFIGERSKYRAPKTSTFYRC